MPKEWMSVQEAAEYLGVARSTIYRWAKEDRLPIYKLAKGVARVRAQDLMRFVREARPLYGEGKVVTEEPQERAWQGNPWREDTGSKVQEFIKANKIGPREELLRRVRMAVREIEPEAQIILYGSRARGDAAPDSDWDFLILLDGPVDHRRATAVRHRLYQVEWDCGEVLSSIVRSRDEWNSTRYRLTPLHAEVEREGIPL